MDLITYFITSKGFDSVFTIIDWFSKYVTFIPYRAPCTVSDLVRIFHDHIVCKLDIQ